MYAKNNQQHMLLNLTAFTQTTIVMLSWGKQHTPYTGEVLTHLPREMLKISWHFLESLRITFWYGQLLVPALSNESSNTTKAKLKAFSTPPGLKLIVPLHQCSHTREVPVNPSQPCRPWACKCFQGDQFRSNHRPKISAVRGTHECPRKL